MLLHPKNSSKTHEKCRLKPIKVDIGIFFTIYVAIWLPKLYICSKLAVVASHGTKEVEIMPDWDTNLL